MKYTEKAQFETADRAGHPPLHKPNAKRAYRLFGKPFLCEKFCLLCRILFGYSRGVAAFF